MDEYTLRVVKIDKEAIFEFIYETFISQEQELLDLSPVDVINDCAMDWEKGEFIFAAHLQENSLGEFNPLPNDIDIQNLLENYLLQQILFSGKRGFIEIFHSTN